MSDQAKRALEFWDEWNDMLLKDQRLKRALSFSDPSSNLVAIPEYLKEAAKIATFFSQIITEIEKNLTDEAKIRELFKDDMENLIEFFYNMFYDNKDFEKIKDFLNK